MESRIVVLGFEGQDTAATWLGNIQQMQEEGLIELEDAVVASRGSGGNVEIEQTRSLTGKYAARGTGIGLLAGLLLGGPIGGLVGGAAIGAITGALKDHGIEDGFVNEVSQWLRPNSSALFLMVKEAKGDEVLKRLEPFKAKVLTTTLSEEQEKRLKATLAEEE